MRIKPEAIKDLKRDLRMLRDNMDSTFFKDVAKKALNYIAALEREIKKLKQ